MGRMRDHNEDHIAWDESHGFALLADGMGGHNAGEVASAIAVDTIQANLLEQAHRREDDAPALLSEAIDQANQTILADAASQPHCAGMGTTIVAVLFHGDGITLAHVGDSRIYRLRGKQFRQMTTDHSLVQELVQNGYLTSEEARASANKNLITRALGIDAAVEVDVAHDQCESGDLFLLCSDGLTDLVPDDEIHTLLNLHADDETLDAAVVALVEIANEKGGADNISVILIRVT